ncbi:MAG TPA: MarR family transcriptional regulator [Tepidisphaeraceae bacterium]|nr:MarR family transcriptional regulator [Tepidisphaeraceae bacterium]
MHLAVEIKKRNPFDSLEQEVYLNLMRTADALGRDMETMLKSQGLSATQYNVLRILRGAGGDGLPCGEVSERMITRDPDMTRLLDRIESRGLITRCRQTRDRRIVMTRITKKGLAALAKLDAPIQSAHCAQLAHLGRKKLKNFLTLLEAARSGPINQEQQ